MVRYVYLLAGAMLFLLAACEASFKVSTAGLSEPRMSEKVDAKSMAPISPADTFTHSVGTLFATIKLSNAPADTEVKAIFYFLGEEKSEIAQDTVKAEGTAYLSFSLNPPASGWPGGTYQVDYYLDGEVKESLRFSVQEPGKEVGASPPSVAPSASAPAASPSARTFRKFEDTQFGFSFELPDNWDFKVVGQRSDYLFTGPAQSDDGEIAIIVQMIDTRKDQQSTLQAEMISQLDRFSGLSSGEILKKSEIQVGGTTAPYFLATYPAANSRNETVAFGHTQLGLQNGPIILLISYAAPRDIYQREVGVFQHMMDTTILSTPNP